MLTEDDAFDVADGEPGRLSDRMNRGRSPTDSA